jgi:hypothetical protein
MRNVIKGLVLGAIALMVIGGSIPASAKAPLKETVVDEGWFTLPDITCDGFVLTEEMDSEQIKITTFYDKAGDETKVALRANFFGTITNTVTNETFVDHASFTETVNLVDGTTTVNGISYHYVVGGQGQVYAEIGHKIMLSDTGEVIFQGGQDDLASDPDLATLCDAMA